MKKEEDYIIIKDFRVLLIYANTFMEPLMPLGIASIFTALKEHGVEVELFDTTFYKENDLSNSQSARESSMQVTPVDYSEVGVKPITRSARDDLRKIVFEFQPHLIGLSCVELTYEQGIGLLKSVQDFDIPTIVGVNFPRIAGQIV